MSDRIAAIDLGTNTARLLIADRCKNNGFKHLRVEREIIRMGGGFNTEIGLSPKAVQRGLSCLKKFALIIQDHGVQVVRAVATSAVRDAANGRAFVEQVFLETGISLEVIDGIQEGKLTLAGVIRGLDHQYNKLLLFDIGGGSTEYTYAKGGMACFVHSLPLGVVRLTEGKVTRHAMERKINKELDRLKRQMKEDGIHISPDTELIGTAGTATTLAAINIGMDDYDYRRVNNSLISKEQIHTIYERLAPLAPEERLAIPGLQKGREDLIIAGILITLQTMELFGIEEMKVSDYGLLEGLVVGMPVAD